MSDRHACRCECPCSSFADASADRCASCNAGFHRPSQRIQDHLRAGIERWIEIMPGTLGSSGLSPKQMAGAADAWYAWHAEQDCPIEARP